MNTQQLQKFMYDMYTDVSFFYRGAYAVICPSGKWTEESGWSLYGVSWKDTDKEYTNFNALMNDPIYDGKTLSEISEDITELEMI